jgi:DNA polymerase-3 subunit beta
VRGNRLEVTGTDSDVTIRTTLEVEVLEAGRTVVPAKLAAEAVRKLPVGAVTLSAEEGEVEITGNGPRFRLREFVVNDFPDIPDTIEAPLVEVDGEAFVAALSQVGVAASGDDARPTLTGVLFEAHDDGLRLVATDSYRLALRDLPGIAAGETALVPYRALREIGRTISDAKLGVQLDGRQAAFSSARGRMTARVIEATFPNYRQLLPDEYPNRLSVSKAALLDAVGRAALVAEDHIPVRLSLSEGGVELSVTRQEVGEETEHIEADYSGEEMTIAFNTRYLTDGVGAVAGDEVVLETIDPLKPGMLSGGSDGFQYLLMPVRL